jgi:predicted nuclease with TOPRIM domain
MNIVENGVNYSVKRFNDLKVVNERLVKVLKSRLDELEQQKKSWEELDAMKKAKTEEGIRIDALQKETDETSASIMEKTHYLRKLDHMLSRLKKNQVSFILGFCYPFPNFSYFSLSLMLIW